MGDYVYLIGSGLLIILIIYLVARNVKKTVDVVKAYSKNTMVDDDFRDNLVKALGGINNIDSLTSESARLKVVVFDLNIVNFEEIKALDAQGVFIKENEIKMIFEYDANSIIDSIDSLR